MTPEPLYARSHGPPPTCPFIQPTMRKSDTRLVPVLPGRPAWLNFSRPEFRTQWFVSASGAAYGPCLNSRQHLFLNFFGRNQVSSKFLFPENRNTNQAFTKAWSVPPLAGGDWLAGRTRWPVAGSGHLGVGHTVGNTFLSMARNFLGVTATRARIQRSGQVRRHFQEAAM
jgi:hypothetical protein